MNKAHRNALDRPFRIIRAGKRKHLAWHTKSRIHFIAAKSIIHVQTSDICCSPYWMLKGIRIWSELHRPQRRARAKEINQLVRAQTAFNRDNGGGGRCGRPIFRPSLFILMMVPNFAIVSQACYIQSHHANTNLEELYVYLEIFI